MDCKNRIIKLRESTGHAPDYVLWLLEYYIRNEGLMVKEMSEGGGDSEKEET